MTVRSTPPSREYLLATYSYDKETGLVRRKIDAASGPRRAGDLVGATDSDGYRVTKIFGKLYKVHLLIWLMETGEWRPGEIDHRNGSPGDNRWSNLRLADKNQQSYNIKKYQYSTSQYKGVSWSTADKRWKSTITARGKTYHLGLYDTEAEAAHVYSAAATALHGVFARQGTLLEHSDKLNENSLIDLKEYLSASSVSDERNVRVALKIKNILQTINTDQQNESKSSCNSHSSPPQTS